MAESSNAVVLKTIDLHGSGGSNPSLSAVKKAVCVKQAAFFVSGCFVLSVFLSSIFLLPFVCVVFLFYEYAICTVSLWYVYGVTRPKITIQINA